MRKLTLLTTVLTLVFTLVFGTAAFAATDTTIDWVNTTKLDKGTIGIEYAVKAKVLTKVMIAKDTAKYTYDLRADRKAEWFPLQLGNGTYTVTILENVKGNQFKVVGKTTVTLKLKDQTVVYLNQTQNVDWDKNNKAVKKAYELTKNLKTDTEKVTAIYKYITDNVKYNKALATTVTNDYLPVIDQTFTTNKDICYGYAALMAGMLRALDIPTKVVMGTTTYVDVYHAWNEVYLNGKWVTIDTTVDAGLKAGKKTVTMIKETAKYKAEKQY